MSTKKIELWIHATKDGLDATVALHISRNRLAAALLDSVEPIVLHEAWANGDSARVVVERIPWRLAEWRITNRGWVKGPYRVWSGASSGVLGPSHVADYQAEHSIDGQFCPGPFETLEMAQRACMRHAGEEG